MTSTQAGTGVLVEVYDDPDSLPGWLYSISSSARERERLAGRLAALRVVLIGRADVAEAVRTALTGSGIEPDRVVGAPYPRQRDELPALMAGADVVVAAGDGSVPALHPWVNAAGLRADIPTLHADLLGTRATIGPSRPINAAIAPNFGVVEVFPVSSMSSSCETVNPPACATDSLETFAAWRAFRMISPMWSSRAIL